MGYWGSGMGEIGRIGGQVAGGGKVRRRELEGIFMKAGLDPGDAESLRWKLDGTVSNAGLYPGDA